MYYVNKERRLRPETMLRLILATSYPQNSLSVLTMNLIQSLGYTQEQVEEVKATLQDKEKEFDMFDFIRCIEIRRTGESLQLILKCLDVDPRMTTLMDNGKTHYPRFIINLDASSVTIDLENDLVRNIVEYYLKTQTRETINEFNNWAVRDKVADRYIESTCTLSEVMTMLNDSLSLDNFTIILTQKAILLPDQKKRIWGNVRKSFNN